MRGLFLSLVTLYLLLLGLSYPFVAALAYVWIDIVKPQDLAYSIINHLPIALIATGVTFVAFLAKYNKYKPRFTAVQGLLIVFAAWITLTSYLADPLIGSWNKWDWAFKVIVFTIFIPFLFRSRVQIEALLLTIIISVGTVAFSAGVKAALGGGGYGTLAIMGGNNTGLAEGSTLAAVCLMLIPLMHYAYKHSIIFAGRWYFKLFILAVGFTTLCSVIGTSARTGLVAGAVLLVSYVLRSKRKLLWVTVLAVGFLAVQQMDLSDTAWGTRMETINTFEQESSALGRLKVWEWTLQFVANHPLGGGFDAFKLNGIAAVTEQGVIYYPPGVVAGKAFHNVYFEVLGEQGIVGIAIYLAMIVITFRTFGRIRRQYREDPDLAWASDLALRLRDALLMLLVGGMFIGIAYQPYIFYFIALGVSMSQLFIQNKTPPYAKIP